MGYGPTIGNIVDAGWGFEEVETIQLDEVAREIGVWRQLGQWVGHNHYSQSMGSWGDAERVTGIDIPSKLSCWEAPRQITEDEVVWWEAQANRMRSESGGEVVGHAWLPLWISVWMRWALENCENPGVEFG